jgi:hypothetical protein
MIMVNGKTAVGYRLDEVTADGPVGMEMLMNPFAIVPKLENAQRVALAFQLLEEWLNTPFFETREQWEKWVAEFRPKVESVTKK